MELTILYILSPGAASYGATAFRRRPQRVMLLGERREGTIGWRRHGREGMRAAGDPGWDFRAIRLGLQTVGTCGMICGGVLGGFGRDRGTDHPQE
jgi:hypothetical protein